MVPSSLSVRVGLSKFIDVIPINDLRPHEPGPGCWCKPHLNDEEPSVVVHRSLDGREAFERGERLPS